MRWDLRLADGSGCHLCFCCWTILDVGEEQHTLFVSIYAYPTIEKKKLTECGRQWRMRGAGNSEKSLCQFAWIPSCLLRSRGDKSGGRCISPTCSKSAIVVYITKVARLPASGHWSPDVRVFLREGNTAYHQERLIVKDLHTESYITCLVRQCLATWISVSTSGENQVFFATAQLTNYEGTGPWNGTRQRTPGSKNE